VTPQGLASGGPNQAAWQGIARPEKRDVAIARAPIAAVRSAASRRGNRCNLVLMEFCMSHSLALGTRMAVILTATFAVACGSDGDEPASELGALQPPFSFFVTGVGSGEDGGDLGGLAGAGATCEQLAEAAQPGAEGRTWRAYLSTEDENARDRIGDG